MSNLRSIASTQTEQVNITVVRNPVRLANCVLLTALNVAVVGHFGETLYRFTAGHPLRFAGVTLLLVALFASLLRVWIVGLLRR